jgi:hypothetical protein
MPVIRLDILYRFAREVTSMDVTSTLDLVTQPNHRHVISVRSGPLTHEAVLEVSRPTAVFATGGSSFVSTFGSFVRLGVKQILTGYAHLAFLLGLLIATTSFRALVKVVTSFMAAHSIALALAVFDVVVLPTRLTESLIALSIAYVAIENLLRNQLNERYRITFLFGLIHGFGFSTVLREMQLPRPNLVLSLLAFNAGLELGQIMFVAVVFLLMIYGASSEWHTRIRPAVSFGVACFSIYWFAQRMFP